VCVGTGACCVGALACVGVCVGGCDGCVHMCTGVGMCVGVGVCVCGFGCVWVRVSVCCVRAWESVRVDVGERVGVWCVCVCGRLLDRYVPHTLTMCIIV